MARKPKSRLRTWLWRIAILAAATSALVTGLAIGVREGLGRDALRAWIERLGSDALGYTVRIGALEGRLLPELRLRDVELRSEHDGATPLLEARSLDLRVDLDPLLDGEPLGIIAIVARGVDLHVARSDQGVWNFHPAAAAEPDPADVVADEAEAVGGPTLRIGRVLLEDATLVVEDGPRRLQVALGASLGPIALPFGPAEAARLGGRLHATLAGQPPIQLDLNEGHARVPGVVLDFAGGQVSIQAEADLAAWLAPDRDAVATLALEVSGVDPAALPVGGWQEGAVSGAVSMQIAREQGLLTSDAALDLSASRIEGFELERAHLRASTRGEGWNLADLEIVGSPLRATARGRGVGLEIGRLDSQIAIADLAPLAELAGVEASGRITLETSASGSLSEPEIRLEAAGRDLSLMGVALGVLDLEARAESPSRWILSSLSLRDGDLAVRLEAPARLDVTGEDFQLGRVSLTSNVADSLELEGGLRGGALAGVRVRASGIDPQILARLAGQDVRLAGSASIAIDLEGSTERPLGSLELDWQAPELGEAAMSFGALRGTWTARGESVEWTIHATDPDAPSPLLELEGRAPWSTAIPLDSLARNAEAAASLHTRELPLRRLGALLPEELQSTNALLSLELRARGGETGPQLVSARGHASGIEPRALASLAGQDVQVAGTVALALDLVGPTERPRGSVRIDWQEPYFADADVGFEAIRGEWTAEGEWAEWALRATDPGTPSPVLELEGRAPWSTAVPLDSLARNAETTGSLHTRELPIRRLGPLVPEALRVATGLLSLELRARGSETGPQLEGQLALSDGSFPVSIARRRFEPIEMQLELAGSRVHVRNLTVGDPGEQLRVTGSLGLAGTTISTTDLNATLDSFQLSDSSILRTRASGTLSLTGPVEALLLNGDLALEETRVLLPEEYDLELREIEVLAASSGDVERDAFVEGDEIPAAFDLASAHVAIRIPAGSRVRGRGAEIDLAGDLELDKKPLDRVRLTGEARVVRGHIQFQRKRFNLERGIVYFDGSTDPTDPVIDFEGVHRVRDVAIILKATGRLSDPPVVELSGNPAMSSDEALAYLVFGRPLDELRDSERGSVQSAAASLAASMALDELARVISRTGVVDTIEIDIAEDGTLDTLRFGTYIGNDTYVRAGNTFGADSEQELQVEYRLMPFLSVESQLSTSGNAGGDLILRLDY